MTDKPHDAAAPAPPAAEPEDDLPATGLRDLVGRAAERFGPTPDRHGPAAVRAMAAIVRDLKGMPNLVVNRESGQRMRLSRRNKVGAITIEYQPNILAIQLAVEGFSGEDPTGPKFRRYTLEDDHWVRLDGSGEDLFADLRTAILRIYPELGPPT
jgi:hypothetical protein